MTSHGANVTVLEMKKDAGQDLEWNVRKMKIMTLKEKGVTILTNSRVKRIEEGLIVFTDPKGTEHSLKADKVVAALGSISSNPFEETIRDMGLGVTCIGDCKKPRGHAEAVSDGFHAVLNLGRS